MKWTTSEAIEEKTESKDSVSYQLPNNKSSFHLLLSSTQGISVTLPPLYIWGATSEGSVKNRVGVVTWVELSSNGREVIVSREMKRTKELDVAGASNMAEGVHVVGAILSEVILRSTLEAAEMIWSTMVVALLWGARI